VANKQGNKNGMQKSSSKTDEQIIKDLIENRKRQMEALVKIMSSFDETSTVHSVPLKPKESGLKKTFKRKTKH
jgi:hypothetical protein